MRILFPMIGLILGILIGLNIPFIFPKSYSAYVAVGILACLDSVFGGVKSNIMNCFDFKIFISGFLGNAIIAMCFVWLGNQLDINLSIAAIVVYGTRLFENFARIRRKVLYKTLNTKMIDKKNKKGTNKIL